jgi:uncharacterized membrane protein YkvA (DUF1232 family)
MSQDRQPVIPPDRVCALTQALRTFQLVWELLKDSRVPLFPKLVMLASAIYLISPIDLIPDVILGLGQLDDLAVFMLSVGMFIELCPRDIVDEHRRKIAGIKSSDEVVDGTYRVVDDDPTKPSSNV